MQAGPDWLVRTKLLAFYCGRCLRLGLAPSGRFGLNRSPVRKPPETKPPFNALRGASLGCEVYRPVRTLGNSRLRKSVSGVDSVPLAVGKRMDCIYASLEGFRANWELHDWLNTNCESNNATSCRCLWTYRAYRTLRCSGRFGPGKVPVWPGNWSFQLTITL